jgi:RNA polymerase sigma-70 factor (ECF subfamily)
MTGALTEFERLMQRLREGEPRAARELFDRYGEAVRRVVRRRLDQRLRRFLDSEDFVQSVWASFFKVPRDQYTFASPADLVAFVSQLASNKVAAAFRRQIQAARRDATREQPLQGRRGRPVVLYGREPSPSQVAIAEEEWQRLLAGQPPRERRILELRREGCTHQEIAEQLGLHPKVVQRLLRKLSQHLNLQ